MDEQFLDVSGKQRFAVQGLTKRTDDLSLHGLPLIQGTLWPDRRRRRFHSSNTLLLGTGLSSKERTKEASIFLLGFHIQIFAVVND